MFSTRFVTQRKEVSVAFSLLCFSSSPSLAGVFQPCCLPRHFVVSRGVLVTDGDELQSRPEVPTNAEYVGRVHLKTGRSLA